jgi:hypothetical protein
MNPNPRAQPVPHAILADHSPTEYLVCWAPDSAGIITRDACIVPKSDFVARWPSVVRTWETQQSEQQAEARRIEKKFGALIKTILSSPKKGDATDVREPVEIRCDQGLLPGMRKHWGRLEVCGAHLSEGKAPRVCEGCRVGHYMQDGLVEGLTRTLVMERGARVPLCDGCAAMFLRDGGAGREKCVCDRLWTCFSCRETELEKLAQVRKSVVYYEGTCGQCSEPMESRYGYIDFCLHCRGVRIVPFALT